VITAGADKTAVIWDLANRGIPVQLGVLTGQFAPVYAVFSPNGKDVAVASQNGTLRWWDLSELIYARSTPVAEACALLGPRISPSEWSPYVDPDVGNSICKRN
jgi:WD40 repeat protein